jgi:glycosyltransferase involved in cell wall biosynthesis
MSSIHVVVPNLTPGDAVSQDALGMAGVLDGLGCDVHLYANEIDAAFSDLAKPLSVYEDGPTEIPDDVLIYHHAVGWRRGVHLYASTRNHRVLKYHNVTPARFFDGINAEYVNSCVEGAEQTRELVGIPTVVYLGDSNYNVRDLLALGIEPSRASVVPPFHQVEHLQGRAADPGVFRRWHDGTRNFLFVGRIVPNKGHFNLLEIFAHYHHYLDSRSRLLLVGALDPRLQPYTQRLFAAVERLNLRDRVIFTDKVRPDELKGYYLSAHAFLCASHHEGFCVPLVEAMAFRLPCVVRATTGLAATLPDEALAWEDFDPALMAESLHACLENEDLGDFLVERQYERYEQLFSPAALRRRLRQALAPLLDGHPEISAALAPMRREAPCE